MPWDLPRTALGQTLTLTPLEGSPDSAQSARSAHGRLSEIGNLLPNNQRQHRTLHIQKDVLPYALC